MKTPKKPTKPATKPKTTTAKTPAARTTKAATTRAAKPPPKPSRKAAPPPPAAIMPAGPRAAGELRGVGDRIELPGGIVATVADAEQIVPSRFNAEGREPDAEMVQSIEDRGVIEPLVVRPVNQAALDHWLAIGGDPAGRLYELVCGEKRWKGAQQAGAARGARVLLLVIVRADLTDQEVADLQFIENFHRSSLTPLQEIDAFVKYQREFGGGPPEIAKHVNKPPAYVAKRIKVGLHLPLPGREALAAGRLLMGAAVEVACLPDAPAPAAPDADRIEALSLVLPRHAEEEAIPVREARDRIVRRFHLQMVHARFDIADATLVEAAGSCMKCPKRSSNQLAMFQESARADDRCMDRVCWQAKTTAAWERKKAEAEKDGKRVLDAQAEGAEGQKAAAILNQPLQHGLVPLDMPCDVLHDAKIEAAQARLDAAEEKGDDEAKTAAEAELDALENAPDEQAIPTWRDVLGKAAPPVALGRARPVWSDRTELVELADERTCLQALKDQGVALPDYLEKRLAAPPSGESKPAERPARPDHDRESRKRTLRRERLTHAILTAGEEAKPDVRFWRAVVHALMGAEPHDFAEGFLPLLRRRNWPMPDGAHDAGELAELVASQAARMSQKELRGVAFELLCLLVDDETLPAFASLMGQDAGAILAQADKDAAAAPEPKKATRSTADRAPRAAGGKAGTCRFCTCTEEHACELPGDPPQACTWIDGTRTICSACAPIVELAAVLLKDGQRCDHCETTEPCEHVAQELHRRAEEQELIAGTFEQHKARIGACLAFAVSRAKKPARKKGAKNAPSTTSTAPEATT